MFFKLSTFWLFVVIFVIVGGSAGVGILLGRWFRRRPDASREPVGVVQGTLLGLVGLLLAFGLSMAVDRYETRRALVVDEANTIGTTYLRAQMLAEPMRSASLELLKEYGSAAVDLASQVPESRAFSAATSLLGTVQNELWKQAGDAVRADPTGTAPRLYIETLNEMIDANTSRIASLRNRVPGPVEFLLVVGSAVALGALSLYLSMLSRNVVTPLVAAVFVSLILFIGFDLDRPQRGLITVPFTPLEQVRASMDGPPAAVGG